MSTRDEMEQEFHDLLTPHFPAGIPDGLVRSLMLAQGGYTSAEIERRAHPDYRWVPKKQRERKAG